MSTRLEDKPADIQRIGGNTSVTQLIHLVLGSSDGTESVELALWYGPQNNTKLTTVIAPSMLEWLGCDVDERAIGRKDIRWARGAITPVDIVKSGFGYLCYATFIVYKGNADKNA